MSAENVCGLTIEKGPYGACFLDFGDGKRCTLHNQGILILPFASKFGLAAAKRASFQNISHDGICAPHSSTSLSSTKAAMAHRRVCN